MQNKYQLAFICQLDLFLAKYLMQECLAILIR